MSTLKVNTIQNTSGGSSSTPEQIEQGRAKVWLNMQGSGTVAINDSFNVSSVTDLGTGMYQANFSITMANTNYSYSTSVLCEDNAPRGPKALGLRVDGSDNATTNTTTARRFECLTGARDGADGTAQDTQNGSIKYHGDLA